MLTFFDLLKQAQEGQGIDAMARQFGLDGAQMENALGALLPAFSQGFTRNVGNAEGVASFMEALSSGHHAAYFDNIAKAMNPEAIDDGNGILGHLFGSKEVSRAIASQASENIDLGKDILERMLPVIASTLMGGLHKQSVGELHAAQSTGGNIIGDIIGQMMRQAGENARMGQEQLGKIQREATKQMERAQTQKNPFGADNPFGRALEEMFKMPSASGANTQSGNPFEDMFRDMMSGGMGGSMDAQKSASQKTQAPKNPFEDAFGEMFKTGKKVQDDYQRGLENIFETYLDGMKKR